MVYQPDPPFPKTRGNAIRAKDWNDTVNEVVRLDQTKLSTSGGTVSGNLAVNGTISGNLATNTVGTSQLANGSVTDVKLANNSINSSHVPASALPVDRLAGYYAHRNLELTVAGGSTELVFFGGAISVETSQVCPLVFFTTRSLDGEVFVECSIQHYAFSNNRRYYVAFKNTFNYVAVVRATVFVLQI